MLQDRISKARYSGVAMALHWLIAAALLFEIGLGWRMDAPRGPQSFAVYQLHKSVGITILLLTLLRLAWRLTSPPPAFPPTMKPWEKALAHATHLGFYALLLGLPLTGWLMVSSARIAIPTLLYGTVPWPHVPGVSGLAAAAKAQVNGAADFGHHSFVYVAYALLALHVAGALKHQFVDRGADMARMLPAAPRRMGVASLAVIAALAGLFALGNRIHLGNAAPAAAAPAVAPVETAAAPEAAPVEAAAAPKPAPAPALDEPAGNTAEPAETAKAAEPVRWTVRKAASSLAFKARWSEGPIEGRFGKWDADILFSPDALDRSTVTVKIDMTSATTGVSDTEQALPGDDWFAAAAHPTATFSAKTFRHLSGDRYEAKGTLSLRGVSKPLTLPFTLKIVGKRATMTGTARIDRLTFGVGQGQWASTESVPAAVSVIVSLSADAR